MIGLPPFLNVLVFLSNLLVMNILSFSPSLIRQSLLIGFLALLTGLPSSRASNAHVTVRAATDPKIAQGGLVTVLIQNHYSQNIAKVHVRVELLDELDVCVDKTEKWIIGSRGDVKKLPALSSGEYKIPVKTPFRPFSHIRVVFTKVLLEDGTQIFPEIAQIAYRNHRHTNCEIAFSPYSSKPRENHERSFH